MKNIMLAAIAATTVAGPAYSGNTTAAGYISSPWVSNAGSLMFNVDAPRTAVPGCQYSAVPQRWEIDARTAVGQVQASVLMTAYSLHKKISVIGINSCAVWGDSETVWFFEVQN